MTPKEINQLLSNQVNDICPMLFPQGKQVGNNFEVGNLDGSPGQSLKIPLSGSNVGMFSDFQSGENGDLINLWQQSKDTTFKESIKEIKSYLNIVDDFSGSINKLSKSNRIPQKPKSLPKHDPIDEVPKWCKYLEKRKISIETASQYKIGVVDDKLLFPHYFDNELIMWHTRGYKKDKDGSYILKDGKPDKDFQTNKSPLYCLWGWDGIKDSDRSVVLTEGRIDAISYIEQGIPALSVPCGGGKGGKQSWIDFDYHNLIDHFDKIYISMDKDSAGSEALLEIISRLGDHRCWIVKMPNGHKDSNEAHIAGESLKSILKTAKQNTPEGLHRAGEFIDDIMQYFYPDPNDKNCIYLPWVKGQKYQARLGEVTMLAGENGSGKTQMIGNIMLAGMVQSEAFGAASMEMSPKMLLGRMTRQATGTFTPSKEYIDLAAEFLNKWLWVYKKKGTAEKGLILRSFLYLNKRYGVKYFVIDSLAKCGINEDDYNGQKNFIDELEAFADDNMCHIFIIHHIRKRDQKNADKPPGKGDVKGTGALIDMIDNLILAWRNKPKEEFLENIQTVFEDSKEQKKYEARLKKHRKSPDAIVNIAKQRNGDWEGKVPLWFRKNCYQYVDTEDTPPYKFVNYSKLDK